MSDSSPLFPDRNALIRILRERLPGLLADVAGCQVDLVDLRAASTVMQHQIITRGECWWSAGLPADLFALYVLDEKMKSGGTGHGAAPDPSPVPGCAPECP